jgi:hypothetical protein
MEERIKIRSIKGPLPREFRFWLDMDGLTLEVSESKAFSLVRSGLAVWSACR